MLEGACADLRNQNAEARSSRTAARPKKSPRRRAPRERRRQSPQPDGKRNFHSRFFGSRSRRRSRRFWLQFPQYVDDLPLTVKLGDFEIVDPTRRDDLYDRRVVETIENRDLFQ